MRIVKKINNNVALAVDVCGKDVVVFGKGIGFPQMPYELDDSTAIQRVFHDVDSRMLEAISAIPDDVLLVSSDIVELARMDLDCKLNPNLTFTLADHLAFAIQRVHENIPLENPLAAEVAYVYPREHALGETGIKMVASRTGVTLPAAEACSIALHLVNAESAREGLGDIHLVMESAKVIEHVTQIVERDLGVELDRSSYGYVRFIAHLRYLVGRLMQGQSVKSGNSSLFRQAALDFPEAYACAYEVDQYLKSEHGWSCTDEELLYLMMHVNRLAAAQ
ncbi:MAG: PRD domain-containing protein [Atopobiaceae bacterium]|jgi:beta-glucoside operon transcriptional antiterminator|nr:PRD domain-containing protein [Atopobiaceae bacterium]